MKIKYKNWIWKIIPFTIFIAIPYFNWYVVTIVFLSLWFIIPFIRRYFSKKVLSTSDIENVALGIGKKTELEYLYKQLQKKVHPDLNPSNVELSNSYSEKLNNNRYNYSELKELEAEINKLF